MNAPALREAEETFGDQLVILHVDQEESLEAVQNFATRYGFTSPFLMDPKGDVGRLYQVRGTPSTYFIDADGIIQGLQPGLVQLEWIEQNLKES